MLQFVTLNLSYSIYRINAMKTEMRQKWRGIMNKVAIVADSNSGITQEAAKEMGVYVVPMPIIVDEKEFLEGVSISKAEFFEAQISGADIKTSQPSLADVGKMWDSLLEEYETVVYIPMTKSLSGSYSTALMLSENYDGRVKVVDNQRISVTQKVSVRIAKQMADDMKTAEEIQEYLEKTALEASIYLTVDTLLYLKKGGRITKTAAAIGEVLNIRPVLQIQGEMIDAYKKVRGRNKAKQEIISAIKYDLEHRFAEIKEKKEAYICIAHADIEEEAYEWKKVIEQELPGYRIEVDALSLNICTHVGKGTIGMAIAF